MANSSGGAVGITTQSDPLQLSAYPNPADDVLHLIIPSGYTSLNKVRLISLEGQTIWQSKEPTGDALRSTEIPLHGIPAGIYLVQLITAEGTAVVKVAVR